MPHLDSIASLPMVGGQEANAVPAGLASTTRLASEPILMFAQMRSKHAMRRATVNWPIALAGISLLASGCSQEQTRYAQGFSEESYGRIEIGATAADVSTALGRELRRIEDPYPETWLYDKEDQGAYFRIFDPSESVTFDQTGRVHHASGRVSASVSIGQTKEGVRSELGAPVRIVPARATVLWYSEPGESGRYDARGLALNEAGEVVEKYAYSTWD